MEEIEIPPYFICPISLQIMADPVTAITGITYDRSSIEKWLKTAKETTTCPVTKQPLPIDSDLTPNHMLRRLIQGWCTANATNGVDRIPTPKPILHKSQVVKLVRDFATISKAAAAAAADDDNHRISTDVVIEALKKMETLVKENERNRKLMEEAGVAKAMVLFLMTSFREDRLLTIGIGEALVVFNLTWTARSEETKLLLDENLDFVYLLKTILKCVEKVDNDDHHVVVVIKNNAMLALRKVTESTNGRQLQKLTLDFFKQVIRVFRTSSLSSSQQAIKSALQVLIEVSQWGRNISKIVEANGAFELIELELEKPEKKISELIFILLAHICSNAEGRASFLAHAGAIAIVSKRILRVTPTIDDRGIHILGLISKFTARNEVLSEMLRVGAVGKMCMVIQADCASYLKIKARDVLRLHSNVWNDSPCISLYLLTRY